MRKHFAKLVALVASGLVAFTLCACGDWSVEPNNYGPGSGGSNAGHYRGVDKRFHYYYGEDCRYNTFGTYDCSDVYVLSPSMYVSLQVTYDGYATLCVDNECSYYDPGEYYQGYDGVTYYDFPGDDTRMTVYADGAELIYYDSYNGYAYYYYYDNPDYYDYYY